jgi:hypothetical protein
MVEHRRLRAAWCELPSFCHLTRRIDRLETKTQVGLGFCEPRLPQRRAFGNGCRGAKGEKSKDGGGKGGGGVEIIEDCALMKMRCGRVFNGTHRGSALFWWGVKHCSCHPLTGQAMNGT